MRLATHLAVPAEPSMPAHSCRAPPDPSAGAVKRRRALIQHPLDRALGDAEIARAQTLIKPADALLVRYLLLSLKRRRLHR